MVSEKAYLLGILNVAGIGPKKAEILKKEFGSYQSVWNASAEKLTAVLGRDLGSALNSLIGSLDPDKQLKDYEEAGYKVLAEFEEGYPTALKNIPANPPLLFYRGDITVLARPCIAIVGSRRASPYGRKAARQISRDLAQAGFAIVSGMARGIDSEAHWGCLEAGQKTVGVLGNGLDVVYPRENMQLYKRVIETGLLVSEFFPGTAPEPGNFPARNRIISGLSRGTVVVEAKEKSGAMITVNFALEQGRDVFAVPGPITSDLSKGPNSLIREGALIVTSAEDILSEWGIAIDKKNNCDNNVFETGIEFAALDIIGVEPVHMDELLQRSGISMGEMAAQLLRLEIEGRIRSLPGQYFVRT